MVTLTERVDRFELVLRRMQRELEALRREARTASAAESEAPAVPVVAAVVAEPEPEPVPTPVVLPPAPEEPHRPRFDLGALLGRFDLLGAGGLAVAGGAVTALGIMLLFVLAAERGWIGPVERVAAGALISTLVFGAGVVLHRRYGQIAAGLAAGTKASRCSA